MTDEDRAKRLIEVEMPLEKISKESRREKNIRKGNISTMHLWWARRPLSASRVAAYASLIRNPEDDDERRRKIDFVESLSTWEATTDRELLDQAKADILSEFDSKSPRVLDPFSGGGALPLEAQRVGCESYALEFNPIAHILNKAVMEFPQWGSENGDQDEEAHIVDDREAKNDVRIIEHIEKWSEWVIDEVKEELSDLYSKDDLGYIWTRTIPCPNPNCELNIPLVRNLWLDKKQNIVYRFLAEQDGTLETEIYHDEQLEETTGNKKAFRVQDSDIKIVPSNGTVQRGSVTCPACGQSFKSTKTREISNDVGFSDRLLFIIGRDEDNNKTYRHPADAELSAVDRASNRLEDMDSELLPKEEIPDHADASRYLTPRTYGYETWGSLFNPRQTLALATFCEKIREAQMEIGEVDEDLVEPVVTYLSLVVGKMANRNSRLSVWGDERIKPTFPNGYLPMEWDYVESNPFSEWTGSWLYSLEYILDAIETSAYATGEGVTTLGDATRLPYDDDYFDAVFTDPPYYDNIPYSYLSDFFYIWIKRALRSVYPDAFATPTTPKASEVIEDRTKHDSDEEAEEFFENQLSAAFSEMNRVLKEDGICTIVFAHKSTEAWAQMVRSLLSSDLVVTATWPIHTERHSRPRSIESAALSSSVYFVCRNRSGEDEGYYTDVQEELREKVHERLDYFWEQGIRGADLLVSAIGPAVQVFGQYEEVRRLSGEAVTVDQLLEETQRLVSDYALGKVLEGDVDLGNIDPETRFYILFRWAFANQKEDYDEVRKLAQVNNANVDKLERIGILDVTRGDARLQPPQNRNIDDPEKVPESNNLPLVDKIHRAAILWEQGDREILKSFIEKHCMSEEFWRSAQAISECLPEEESRSQKEKQMLHGLLGYGGQTDFEGAGQSTLGKYTDGGQGQ